MGQAMTDATALAFTADQEMADRLREIAQQFVWHATGELDRDGSLVVAASFEIEAAIAIIQQHSAELESISLRLASAEAEKGELALVASGRITDAIQERDLALERLASAERERDQAVFKRDEFGATADSAIRSLMAAERRNAELTRRAAEMEKVVRMVRAMRKDGYASPGYLRDAMRDYDASPSPPASSTEGKSE